MKKVAIIGSGISATIAASVFLSSKYTVYMFDSENIRNFESFNNIKKLYADWNFWIVFTAGFTPIPFKLITISSGTFNINFYISDIGSSEL